MATKRYLHNIKLGTGSKLQDSDGNDITLTKDMREALASAETAPTGVNPVVTKVEIDKIKGGFKSIHLVNATGVIVVNHELNSQNLFVQAWSIDETNGTELIEIACKLNSTDALNKVDIDFGADTIASVNVNIISMPVPIENPAV